MIATPRPTAASSCPPLRPRGIITVRLHHCGRGRTRGGKGLHAPRRRCSSSQSTSWRIRMNISRCVPGRERPRGCIVPTRTPARARRRSGANGASGASSSMSIISAASRHPRGAARPKQVSHGRCPASAAAGLREPQGVNRSSRFESIIFFGADAPTKLVSDPDRRPKLPRPARPAAGGPNLRIVL